MLVKLGFPRAPASPPQAPADAPAVEQSEAVRQQTPDRAGIEPVEPLEQRASVLRLRPGERGGDGAKELALLPKLLGLGLEQIVERVPREIALRREQQRHRRRVADRAAGDRMDEA